MRRLRLLTAALVLAITAPAWASPAEISGAIPGAEKVGEARYEVLLIPLFNAELWAADGRFSWNRPFALALTYERSARSSTLVNRGLSEMSRRGAGDAEALAPLRARLEACFPNVARGDRITGVSTGADTARFFYNGARSCDVEWPGFSRHFFGIWLDARGGQAAMSARLRGEA
jgi:hypothetical protein